MKHGPQTSSAELGTDNPRLLKLFNNPWCQRASTQLIEKTMRLQVHDVAQQAQHGMAAAVSAVLGRPLGLETNKKLTSKAGLSACPLGGVPPGRPPGGRTA